MTTYNTLYETMNSVFSSMYVDTVALLPTIMLAAIIVMFGFAFGDLARKIVDRLIKKVRVDEALVATGIHTAIEKSGYKLNSGYFIGTLIKWFVITATFIVALDLLNLHVATEFMRSMVLGFLPNVIVATLILFGAIILAHVVEKAIVAATTAMSFKLPALLGKVAKYAILTFATLAVLNQLQIAAELVQMLFGALVFAVALAFGIAFGLGGKDAAGRAIDSLSHPKE